MLRRHQNNVKNEESLRMVDLGMWKGESGMIGLQTFV